MGFWRKCRITFRWLRIAAWLLVLALLGAFLWLNRVGLPDFLKKPLVAALREQGVALEFSRMRFSLIRGLVADNVVVGQHAQTNSPVMNARMVELELDYPALWHQRLALNGLILRDGVFTLPVSPTNTLTLTNLQAALRFGTNDVWSLDRLAADFSGARINISGEVAHAREAANWEIFRGSSGRQTNETSRSLQTFSDSLRRIDFPEPPALRLKIFGDARDIHSIVLQLDIAAPGVITPWFTAVDFAANVTLNSPSNAPVELNPAWGFWTNLQPYRLAWSTRLKSLRTGQLALGAMNCSGLWTAPVLTISNLAGQLGNGGASASATLNLDSRRVQFSSQGGFDPHLIEWLLPAETRKQLKAVTFKTPPVVTLEGSLKLPAWTNFSAPYEPSPTVSGMLAATNVSVRGFTLDRIQSRFRYFDRMLDVPDLSVIQGRTALQLSGQVSELTQNFRFLINGQIDSAIAKPFLTDSNAASGFGQLTMNEPLKLTVDVAGNFRRLANLSATGQVALANFAIRGQQIDSVKAAVTYSNLTAEFLEPRLTRAGGSETFSADKLILDLAGLHLYFVNGIGHVTPIVVGRAIGPKTTEAMLPYQFLTVPTAHVNGCVPLKQIDGDLVLDDADMRFDIVGTAPFRWKKFETPAIGGSILWKKNLLIITNAAMDCYTGSAHGWGWFDLKTPGEGTDFSFFLQGTNVDFHRMGMALWSPTNHLEGALAGTVYITDANSSDWRTWNGYGNAQLRDGLLWDVPMFAFMSPVLNTFSPGLGNSRATEAKGLFTMTNGVIHTGSLIIEAQTMRLEYIGTVDLEENVQARVTARLLRNMPVIGSIMSFVLTPVSKIFECRVTGTLGDPKVSPIYIPKILLVPLHPIRSIEELFSSSPNTNSPAATSGQGEK